MNGPGTTVLIVDDQMPFRMAARSVVGVTPDDFSPGITVVSM